MPPRITEQQRTAILAALAQGERPAGIARRLGITARQVAAVSAHVTMGSYKAEQSSMVQHVANDGVAIGPDVDTGGMVYWDPLPSQGMANPHILIVGGSGYGKTYACSCLIAELANRELPSIVFDYAQGFTAKSLPSGFDRQVELHEVVASRTGIDINPLQLFSADVLGPVNVAQRVADTFKRVFPQLGIQQHAVLRDAVIEVLARAGIRADQVSSWKRAAPQFKELHDYMVELGEETKGPSKRVIQTLAAHVSTLFVFNTLRPGGHKLDWSTLLSPGKSVTVLQLKGLEHSLSEVVTEFLLWNLLGFVEDRGPHAMSAFVVLDEAHRLSFDGGSPVERLLREGRKFGLGVMLSSQQPSDFSPVAYSNTATKLVFQVDDDGSYVSRQIARKTSSHSLRQVESLITRLPRGTAYAVLGNSGQVVQIQQFQDRVKRWSS
jgi:DNA phosphorothioation-dependent restriction protein DptH